MARLSRLFRLVLVKPHHGTSADLTKYDASNITTAPYVEYSLPMVKGENAIKLNVYQHFRFMKEKCTLCNSVDGTYFLNLFEMVCGGALGESVAVGRCAEVLPD